jgi:hypothetical protein
MHQVRQAEMEDIQEEVMAEIFGLEVPDLPEGWQPTEFVMVLKCMLPEDEISDFPYALASRASSGLSFWEADGMIRWAMQNVKAGEAEDG